MCSLSMVKVVGSVSFGCSRNWEWLIGCARSICSLSRMIPIFLRSTYLLARSGPSPLAVAPDDPAFASYLQFLHLGEAGLAGPMNAVFVGRALAPEAERNARVTNWALETFHSRLGLVIQRLANRPFLAGDQFTAADISVSYALLLGLRTSNYTPGSVERAYLARTTTRPAYARAMEICQATKAWAEGSPTL